MEYSIIITILLIVAIIYILYFRHYRNNIDISQDMEIIEIVKQYTKAVSPYYRIKCQPIPTDDININDYLDFQKTVTFIVPHINNMNVGDVISIKKIKKN